MSGSFSLPPLNWLVSPPPSTTPSPQNPTTDRTSSDDLSLPVQHDELAKQLELWANVQFNFDSSDALGFALPDDAGKEETATERWEGEQRIQRRRDEQSLSRRIFDAPAAEDESSTAEPVVPGNTPAPSAHDDLSHFFSLTSAAAAASVPLAPVDPDNASVDPFASLALFAPHAPAPELPPIQAESSPSDEKAEAKLTPGAEEENDEEDKPKQSRRRRTKKVPLPPVVPRAGETMEQAKARIEREHREAEEAAKRELEEDKRRRNTAASARFRVKKKAREAALEQTANELQARVSELEKEVDDLRKENGWLRGLIVGGAPAHPPSEDDDQPSAKRARV